MLESKFARDKKGRQKIARLSESGENDQLVLYIVDATVNANNE